MSVIVSQDLSGIGQVSLGVALPVLTAMRQECALLPTAVLSTHTGFEGNTFTDLSAQMPAVLQHWQQLDWQPDGLLLGYLGTTALPIWQQWLPRYQALPVRVVDPVMGDDGKLYRGFDAAYVTAMRTLGQQATVVTPNLTEAQLLLGEPLTNQPYALEEAAALAERLAECLQVAVVVTGVPLATGDVGVVGGEQDHSWQLHYHQLAGHYFGTGDIFASVLCGGLLNGFSLQAASDLAATFIARAITATQALARDPRLGVTYATSLPWLIAQLKEEKHATHN